MLFRSSLPSSTTFIAANNNLAVYGGDIYSNEVVGVLKAKRLTGTLDGSGNAALAHGISAAQQKVLLAAAYYKGASNEAVPLTIDAIDGANIFLSGGVPSSTYRVSLQYTESLQSGW